MNLTELLSCIPYFNSKSNLDNIEVSGIEIDSRKVKKGDLFVCITGFLTDGHLYIDDAIENGAIAILTQKPVEANRPTIQVNDTSRALAMLATRLYDYPTKQLPLIGVTGTNGKTTVTYILEKIFKQYQKKTGIIGTIHMKIGDDAYPAENTTPNALELQRTFRKMVDEKVDQAIMEVSSHALDLGRVFGSEFDIAVFTNLTQDHLDYHPSIEDYLRAKTLLFSQLGNSYNREKNKFAIINEDEPSSHLLKRSTAQHIITYGCQTEADVYATEIDLSASGTKFNLHTPIGSTMVNSKLIGKFNVYNMLAATAAAISAKVPLSIIKEALEWMNGVNGRFEVIDNDLPFTVIVDYAHTPDSLENVLKTIKDFQPRKLYVIVGCGGDRDKSKRPLMAKIALKYGDYAFFTSDNPRTEDPEQILDDMVSGLEKTNDYEVIIDRKEAIYKAIQVADENDVILIAGKGHETYQQIGHRKYDFDDRIVAKDAIKLKE